MKRMLTAVLALSLVLSLCACGSGMQDETPTYPVGFSGLETLIDDARDEGRLTVCGDGDEAYMTALCQKFETLFGISVTFRPTAKAENARGDVWLGGSDTCRALAAEGKLLAYPAENAGHLTNAAFGDSDGYWYGVAADAVVFAVNADVLRRMGISAPKDWADLTDPVYRELLWVPDYRTTEVGQLVAQGAAVQLGRMRQAARELVKAYIHGVESAALDDVFELLAWNQGIGFFSSEIGPSALFQAYKLIKNGEKQGKSREDICSALREKFGEKNPEMQVLNR